VSLPHRVALRHLVLRPRHGVSRDQAFLLAQLAVLGCEVSYVVDADGDIILAGAQLPLEGLF